MVNQRNRQNKHIRNTNETNTVNVSWSQIESLNSKMTDNDMHNHDKTTYASTSYPSTYLPNSFSLPESPQSKDDLKLLQNNSISYFNTSAENIEHELSSSLYLDVSHESKEYLDYSGNKNNTSISAISSTVSNGIFLQPMQFNNSSHYPDQSVNHQQLNLLSNNSLKRLSTTYKEDQFMNNDITFNDFNQSTSILSPNSPETPNHEQYYMRLDTTNIKNNNSKSGSTYVSSAKQTRNQLRNQFNAFDIGDTLQTKDPDIIENSKSTMHPLDILLAHKKMPQQSSNKIYTTNKADTNIHNRNDSIYSDMDDSNYEDEPIVGDGGNSCSSRGSISSKASHGAPRTLTKDDKRKRNTAASARFRKKKKMKEQELQSTATEMTDKAQRMQEKVHELETEIKWLKALVVEKNEARLEQLVRNKPSHSIAFPTANTLTRQESDKISSFKK